MSTIAVIGAGVLGASIAWRLAEDGHSVAICDPAPGGIASRGSFAWLNASSAEDAHYARTRLRALDLWHELARARPDCPVAFPGMLLWEVHRGELEAMARALSALGHRAGMVDRGAIARIEPGLTAAPDSALWLPTEGRADPRAIAGWFGKAALDAGAAILPERVTRLERRDGGWRLRLGLEDMRADEVVVAAGAATPDILAPLGLHLRLRTAPGLLVRSAPAPAATTRILGSPEVHFWQAADGTVLAGSDYGGTRHSDDPGAEAQAILDRAGALAGGLGPLAAESIAVTDRPMLPDDRPAVGRLAEGLSVAVTHSGMTLAPLIAGAVAAEIAGRDPDPLLAPYRADRPAVAGETAEAR